MKAKVFDVKGKELGLEDLPPLFKEPVRVDLILRAVRSELSQEYQPKGVFPLAGMQTSADYIGNKDKYRSMKNRGAAMLPHEKLPKGRIGRVRRIPSAVTGRRAHPPKVEKVLVEKINKKEYLKALRSALSATADPEWVERRHGSRYEVPFIVDGLESLKKAKEVISLLNAMGLYADVEKSARSRKRITGVRRKRLSRAYRVRKSILFVVDGGWRAGSSLPGVDVVSVDSLRVKDLAPGALPGRLVVWSKKAFERLGEVYGNQ